MAGASCNIFLGAGCNAVTTCPSAILNGLNDLYPAWNVVIRTNIDRKRLDARFYPYALAPLIEITEIFMFLQPASVTTSPTTGAGCNKLHI